MPVGLLRALLVALLAVLGWLWPGVLPALAHTGLAGSVPAAGATVERLPPEVTLTFSKDLVSARGASVVEVIDAGGTDHATGEPDVVGRTVTQHLTGSPSGLVEVRWKVVAADGHPVTGRFSFTVVTAPGPASSPPPSPTPTPSADPEHSPVTPASAPPGPAALDVGKAAPWLVVALLAAAVGVALVRRRAGGRPGDG